MSSTFMAQVKNTKLVKTEAHFWAAVLKTETCWIWQGRGHTSWGAGYTAVDCVREVAHHHAWRMLVGPVGEGRRIRQVCQNCLCVNPEHLEEVANSGQKIPLSAHDIILTRWGNGETLTAIARDYGVRHSTIQRIVCPRPRTRKKEAA